MLMMSMNDKFNIFIGYIYDYHFVVHLSFTCILKHLFVQEKKKKRRDGGYHDHDFKSMPRPLRGSTFLCF